MKKSFDPIEPLSPINFMDPIPKPETLIKNIIKRFGKYSWIPILILVVLIAIVQYKSYKDSLNALPEDALLEIRFLDVGQADSALLFCEGQTMLIDGGNVGDGQKLYSILKEEGIEVLNYVICTHAHEDHVGGLSAALTASRAETVFCPVTDYNSSAFRDFAERTGEITVPQVGYTFSFGGSHVEILACDPTAENPNNTSIVLKITYGLTSFLFTGDAESPVEQTLLDSGFNPSAHVLKVGHHGSSSSTSYRFLNAVMPQYAVISVGEENKYGHPEEEVLTRLRDADVTVFRTDLDGDIYCISDGTKVTFTQP
ncbi:MAG: MBL fold metallo-hydrolase [Oscillospiraceae bacterium]|nr:MBL fold metallo-hydrolase [Oscillospiraceae bacterium]